MEDGGPAGERYSEDYFAVFRWLLVSCHAFGIMRSMSAALL
jgi:hypothetical protein